MLPGPPILHIDRWALRTRTTLTLHTILDFQDWGYLTLHYIQYMSPTWEPYVECRRTNSSSPYHYSNKAFDSVSNKSTFVVFNPIHIGPDQTLLVQARIALKFGVEWLICTLNQVVELLSSWCSDGFILKSLLAIIWSWWNYTVPDHDLLAIFFAFGIIYVHRPSNHSGPSSILRTNADG